MTKAFGLNLNLLRTKSGTYLFQSIMVTSITCVIHSYANEIIIESKKKNSHIVFHRTAERADTY